MQTLAMNESFVRELTMDELNLIAGGAWSWKEFGRSTASGAVGGAIAGSFEGGVGAIPQLRNKQRNKTNLSLLKLLKWTLSTAPKKYTTAAVKTVKTH